jgi:hypothetical protein
MPLTPSLSGERRGLPSIPDYGNGWNPLHHFRPEIIDCWYPAWAASGATWYDMGPHAQHLIASGAPTVINGPRDGLKGRKAVSLTSSDYYSASRKASAPTGASKITIVVWYPTSTSNAWLFGKGNSDADEEWLHANLGGLYYDSGSGSYVQGSGGTAHSANFGYVSCGKNNGSSHQCAVIGSSGYSSGWTTATRSTAAASGTGPIQLGRGRNGTGSYTGYIADALCIRGTYVDALADDLMLRFARYYGIR